VQLLRQFPADGPEPEDAHPDAGQVCDAARRLGRCPEAEEHALGGKRRRIAARGRTARTADDVGTVAPHRVHVGDRHADVLAGQEQAPQAVQGLGVRPPKRRRLVARRIADDHRLAAAPVQADDGVLVGHAPRQAQRIADRRVRIGVAPEPRTTQGRTEPGVVYGDDSRQARCIVVGEGDVLVGIEVTMMETHCSSP